MALDLFLNPITAERETPTGVTYRKVIYPPTQDRIELCDQVTNGWIGLRKMTRSLPSKVVRFFALGIRNGIHRP